MTELKTLQAVPSVTLESLLSVLRRLGDAVRRASDPSQATAARQALAGALEAASCGDLLDRQIRAIDGQRAELANLKALAEPEGDGGAQSAPNELTSGSPARPPSSLRPRYTDAS